MDNMENLVTEQVTENVEPTTEESPKMYSQDELNDILGKRLARKEAKIRKEYENKYGHLENVLKAGTGKETVEEMTNTFEEFYKQKGIEIKKKPEYSDRDIEVLARRDAEDIIGGGYEEVVEETDRLSKKGIANMTAREKVLFKTLAEHRQNTERGRELSKIGVTEDVYTSKEFKDFANKFNASTPIRDIYDLYAKTQPKKEIKPMGSMRSIPTANSGVKDFYTYEEAVKFTKKDYDNNPALYKAVQDSMAKWK